MMFKPALRKVGFAAAMLTALALVGSRPASAQARILRPLSPSLEGSIQSIHADTPTSVLFVNLSRRPLVVFWLDYAGQRVFYNTVPAGRHYVQETFLTHPWLVTTTDGVRIAIFQPNARPAAAVITQAMVRAAGGSP